MNRERNYYRHQRQRIIRKKRRSLRWISEDRPDGVFAKNKFHCPARARQIKTTPKAKTYHYGDHKHNWRPRDARTIHRMQAELAEMYREGEL